MPPSPSKTKPAKPLHKRYGKASTSEAAKLDALRAALEEGERSGISDYSFAKKLAQFGLPPDDR